MLKLLTPLLSGLNPKSFITNQVTSLKAFITTQIKGLIQDIRLEARSAAREAVTEIRSDLLGIIEATQEEYLTISDKAKQRVSDFKQKLLSENRSLVLLLPIARQAYYQNIDKYPGIKTLISQGKSVLALIEDLQEAEAEEVLNVATDAAMVTLNRLASRKA